MEGCAPDMGHDFECHQAQVSEGSTFDVLGSCLRPALFVSKCEYLRAGSATVAAVALSLSVVVVLQGLAP